MRNCSRNNNITYIPIVQLGAGSPECSNWLSLTHVTTLFPDRMWPGLQLTVTSLPGGTGNFVSVVISFQAGFNPMQESVGH